MNKIKGEKIFHSWDVGRFHINFPNGNQISTVWGSGSYSDNHNDEQDFKFPRMKKTFDSDTCEIMFRCGDKLRKRILKKYNDGNMDPIGYLIFESWLEIVNLLNKEISKT